VSPRERLVAVARGELGVREVGTNKGPRVEEYLGSVGLKGGFAWCSAFVYWCFSQTREPGKDIECPRTAGALAMWEKAESHQRRLTPTIGSVFVLAKGKGLGHVGIVEQIHEDGRVTSIEGNTNAEGSREGDCVARHTWDPRTNKRGWLVGFLDFFGTDPLVLPEGLPESPF
jgi:uncharacterized protein (TIGR02594 family)